ncbi:RNA polymerase subunit sigma-70 [Oceanidesulfovibrio indonesiensis]|uniref:RNA polymerase subunit sigma-70 n=1 Tax=Oceanidesulfovibrio indonesiensis TaxID=54767 RepID=A0A7M3MAG5_9BACT|nr:sigma-70 family RNA polymerase sigma factor [Oceanidesulfovibrio indonesiensis]TVM13876.1 RNA polymerase subunit sigma-70 [Oceanidesulfovibrio indonesiensis]
MEATGKGDLKAFEEIVRRYQHWAWGIAIRFLGDECEAADIVQEGFIRLLRSSRHYKRTATLKTYFHTIITRLCLDRAKKKHPIYTENLPDVPDSRPGSPESLMHLEEAAQVRRALDSLPPNQRMAIVLRYYEELSYEEIASALGTTRKAVERLLARGRARLRSDLGDRDDFL